MGIAFALAAAAAVAAAAAGGGRVRKRIRTMGPSKPPRVKRAPKLNETITVTYTRTNAAGVVGGLVPNTQKDAPDVEIPGLDFVGKIVSGVVGALVKLTKKATGGKLFPDTWTETQGELFELARLAAKGPVRVWAEVDTEAGYDEEWYKCRRLVFDSWASASRVLTPVVTKFGKPGQKPGKEKGIACMYNERKYKQAGLAVRVIPRPHAPGDIRLFVVLTKEGEAGVYLWMPPRLGRHRAAVHLVVWDKGGK